MVRPEVEMSRVCLTGVLCLSFVSAQGHVLRTRVAQGRGVVEVASAHYQQSQSPSPRPDCLGGSTTRALWKALSFHWHARPQTDREPLAVALATSFSATAEPRAAGECGSVSPVLRV